MSGRYKRVRYILDEAAKPILAVALVPLSIYIICRVTQNPELNLKYMGIIFQLAGIGIVLFQISTLRKLFGLDPFSRIVMKWFGRVYTAIKTPLSPSMSFEDRLDLGVSFLRGKLEQKIFPPNPDDSPEEQIKTYLKNIHVLHADLSKIRVEFQEALNDQQSSFNQATQSLAQRIHFLEERLKKANVEDHGLELLGIFWIAVGIFMSTAPKLLVNWLC